MSIRSWHNLAKYSIWLQSRCWQGGILIWSLNGDGFASKFTHVVRNCFLLSVRLRALILTGCQVEDMLSSWGLPEVPYYMVLLHMETYFFKASKGKREQVG